MTQVQPHVYVWRGQWWDLRVCPAVTRETDSPSGRMERSRKVRKHPAAPDPALLDLTERRS